MIQIQVKKENLKGYLTPFSFQEILVFSQKFLDREGFFGIRNNTLIFISMEKIEDEFIMDYPADISEAQACLITADYLVQRVLISEKTPVLGINDISNHDLKIETLRILNKFINNFKENSYLFEKIKHNDI